MAWLLTGGNGYLGQHVLMQENRPDLVVLDIKTSQKQFPNSIYLQGDIKDFEFLTSISSNFDIEGVIHAAADKNIRAEPENLQNQFLTNIIGTKNLIRFSEINKINKFIFLSSAAVYSETNSFISEESTIAPPNYYGLTKLFGEDLLLNWAKNSSADLVILRLFNLVGVDSEYFSGDIGGLPAVMIRKALSNEELIIYTEHRQNPDRTSIRDYVDVRYVAKTIIKLIELIECKKIRGSEILNLGSSAGCSIMELLRISEIMLKKDIRYSFGPDSISEVPLSVSDSSKIEMLTDLPTRFSTEESLASLINYYRNIRI